VSWSSLAGVGLAIMFTAVLYSILRANRRRAAVVMAERLRDRYPERCPKCVDRRIAARNGIFFAWEPHACREESSGI
jgi:hypothetical protein